MATGFHIRDDFDGAVGSIYDRPPNVRDNAPDSNWNPDDNGSSYSDPGDPESCGNFGLLLQGAGTARCKHGCF